MDIYKAHGYENRKAYLKSLAEEYGVPYSVVSSLASMLGASEDFDGLICELEDYAEYCE